MTPFKLTIFLQTAMIKSTPSPLDAIILGEYAIQENDPDIRPRLGALFKTTNGVPHASLPFYISDNRSIHVQRLSKRINEASSHDAPYNGQKMQANKFKNDWNGYATIAIPELTYVGTGDITLISALLQQARAIGPRRADGYGLIRSFRLRKVDKDPSTWGLLTSKGQPVRHVPIDTFSNLSGAAPDMIEIAKPRPFYWDPSAPMEACACPPTLHPDYLGDDL